MLLHQGETIENQKKPETVASYWLFGIDLMKPSRPILRQDEFVQEPNVTGGHIEEMGRCFDSPADSEQRSDLSKASQDKRQVLQLASPRDKQSNHSSTRSRTKVYICIKPS